MLLISQIVTGSVQWRWILGLHRRNFPKEFMTFNELLPTKTRTVIQEPSVLIKWVQHAKIHFRLCATPRHPPRISQTALRYAPLLFPADMLHCSRCLRRPVLAWFSHLIPHFLLSLSLHLSLPNSNDQKDDYLIQKALGIKKISRRSQVQICASVGRSGRSGAESRSGRGSKVPGLRCCCRPPRRSLACTRTSRTHKFSYIFSTWAPMTNRIMHAHFPHTFFLSLYISDTRVDANIHAVPSLSLSIPLNIQPLRRHTTHLLISTRAHTHMRGHSSQEQCVP